MALLIREAEVDALLTMDEAIAAVHEFLRFQIEDHHTGDSREVTATHD